MKRNRFKYHSSLAPQACCPLLTSKALKRSWLILLAQSPAAVYYCFSGIFSLLLNKESMRVGHSLRGDKQRKRCLCVLCEAFREQLSASTHWWQTVCHRFKPSSSSHTLTQNPASKWEGEREGGGRNIVFLAQQAPSVESGLVLCSASGLLVVSAEMQLARKQAWHFVLTVSILGTPRLL